MEIESSSAPIMGKKVWNKVKVMLYMLRKTLAKTKLLVDLHIKLKNGKLAMKAFTSIFLHHHYVTFTCRCTSNNIDTLFISPQEHISKRSITSPYNTKLKSHHHPGDDNNIERVLFEVSSNDGSVTIESSPLVLPTVVSSELKVVGSPMNDEEESQVDKAAEEFIKKFYRQLQLQKITSVESPSPHHFAGSMICIRYDL